ncbi:MAG: serine hydrolase domain-containing protein [Sedimenticola sp.]
MRIFLLEEISRPRLTVAGLCCCVAVTLLSCKTTGEIPSNVSSLRSDYEPLRQEAGRFIRHQLRSHKLHAISVALVHDQEVIWSEGFGYADRENRKIASGDTIYQIGSITKPLTAMAVMQLAEQGKIDIDHPLQAYIPGFSIRSRFTPVEEHISPYPENKGEIIHRIVDGNPITLRNMLSHHSGLPSDLNKGMYSSMPLSELAERVADEDTAYPPNLVYSYSNLAYSLLGHAIEKETGENYQTFMEQRILSPLRMEHSAFRPDINRLDDYIAVGYKGNETVEPLPIRDLPAKGLYSSANDLTHFIKMLFAGGTYKGQRLIMRETLEEMFEVQNTDVLLDLNVHNGLGWFIEKTDNGKGQLIARHAGNTLLHNSEIAILPAYKLGVIVLSNDVNSKAVVSRTTREVLNLALDILKPQRSGHGFLVEDFVVPGQEIGHVAAGGCYSTQFGLLRLSPDNTSMELEGSKRKHSFDLVPYPNGWFGLHRDAAEKLPDNLKPLCEVQFATRKVDGRQVMFARKGDKQVLLGEQVPTEAVPGRWLKRIGHYRLTNPDQQFPVTDIQLRHQNDLLWLSYRVPRLMRGRVNLPLVVISDTEAVILGLGRTRGETVRIEFIDGTEYLRHSGYISRKIR